jgi:selenocysteine-specific elongation factor
VASVKDIVSKSRLEKDIAANALNELMENGKLLALEEGNTNVSSDLLVIAMPHWNALRDKTLQFVSSYHQNYPLRRGIPREELKSKLKLQPRVFNACVKKLIADNSIADFSAFVAKTGYEIKFNAANQLKVQAVMRKFAANPYSTPSVKESQAEVGEDVFNALIELNKLVMVSQEVVFRKADYDELVNKIREALQQKGQITLAEARDMLNTTRKYVQALLEHLDAIGVTMRDGDARKLRG